MSGQQTVIRVECSITLDMDACPVVRGSAAYLRPRQVEWSATSRSPVPHAYVTGWMRDSDRWARGGAGFTAGPSSHWAEHAPDWLPRPPDGWLASIPAAVQA